MKPPSCDTSPTPGEVLRFAQHVVLPRATSKGCWEWAAGLFSNGYGCFKWRGKSVGAHVFSYLAFVGLIPEGLELDHRCRNRKCVRPDHLEAVTHKVNMERGEWAIRDKCSNGHLYSEHVRVNAYGERECRECGRQKARRHRGRPAETARPWRSRSPEFAEEVAVLLDGVPQTERIALLRETYGCSRSTAYNYLNMLSVG